jgi:hypothetical protein
MLWLRSMPRGFKESEELGDMPCMLNNERTRELGTADWPRWSAEVSMVRTVRSIGGGQKRHRDVAFRSTRQPSKRVRCSGFSASRPIFTIGALALEVRSVDGAIRMYGNIRASSELLGLV